MELVGPQPLSDWTHIFTGAQVKTLVFRNYYFENYVVYFVSKCVTVRKHSMHDSY